MTEKTEYAARYTKTDDSLPARSPQYSEQRWNNYEGAAEYAEKATSWHNTPPVHWAVDVVKITTSELIETYVPEFVFPTATGSVIEAESDSLGVPRILWARDDDGEWISLDGSFESTPADELENPVLKFDAGAE